MSRLTDLVAQAKAKDPQTGADLERDPHGIGWDDALPNLQGLARYAAAHSGVFRRVEAMAEVGGRLRVLDLARPDVRKAIENADGAKALYEGTLAVDYPEWAR